MPTRSARAKVASSKAPPRVAVALPAALGSVVLRNASWLAKLGPRIQLSPGEVAPKALRVPVADANKILRSTVRLVANLPVGSSGDVVWTQGASELLVRTAGISLACAPGLVTIGLPVHCDQLGARAGDAVIAVPLAVGSPDRDAGLVMSTLSRPSGPAEVVTVWSEALTAFAWEALLHLCQQLSAAVGNDRSGKKLVPVSIGADRNVLLVQPMARHDLAGRTV